MVADIKKEIFKKFGEKVKLYGNSARLTQEQLAEKCECSAQTISGIETGRSFPSSTVLFKISQTLNVPLVYLFNFGEDKALEFKQSNELFLQYYNKLNKVQQEVILKVIKGLSEKS